MRRLRPLVGLVALAVLVVAGCAVDAGSGSSQAPPEVPTTAIVESDELEAIIDEVRGGYGSPGAFALLERDGVVGFASSGTATVAGGVMTPDSTFRIASITKPVVAALVLWQVEQGVLGLDDPLASYMPGVVGDDDEITMRMLLDHTSGIYDPQEGDPIRDITKISDPVLRQEAEEALAQYRAGETAVVTDRAYLAIAETHPHYFEPGTAIHYSNTNYQLAGMVLTSITGESLESLLARFVNAPLGLDRTTLTPPDFATPDIHGYGTSVSDESLVDLTNDLVTFGNGASGGIVSTPAELSMMIEEIVAGDLLDDDLARDMRAGSRQSGFSYGLGLAAYETSCGLFYGHEGGVNGMASIAMSSLDGAANVVIGLNMRGADDPGLPVLAGRLLCEGP